MLLRVSNHDLSSIICGRCNFECTRVNGSNRCAVTTEYLFILADDLGIGDLGCYGQQRIHPPQSRSTCRTGNLFYARVWRGKCLCPVTCHPDYGTFDGRLVRFTQIVKLVRMFRCRCWRERLRSPKCSNRKGMRRAVSVNGGWACSTRPVHLSKWDSIDSRDTTANDTPTIICQISQRRPDTCRT